jgi:hypothetical protein
MFTGFILGFDVGGVIHDFCFPFFFGAQYLVFNG